MRHRPASIGGARMAKVVRAFSIDPEVARMIDRIAEKNQTWAKKPNKSKVVNQALRWYYLTDIAEIIEMKDSEIEWWRKRSSGVSKQGVKHHLAGLLRCLNPFRRQKRE